MEISVGTSGWSFADWVGTYYPPKLPKSDWIRFYARDFPVAEINSTYYRIASPKTYAALDLRTPEDFEFFAKVHADVTHGRKDEKASMRALRECLKPLSDSGKLKGLLTQFPPSFRYGQEAKDYLLHVRDLSGGLGLYVEFRHESWWKNEAFDFLHGEGLHYVSIDAPKLPGLMISALRSAGEVLYVRFHGRNAAAWWNREKGDRYDYLYSEAELMEHGEAALGLAQKVKHAYLLFNNCHAGKAVRNAKWLKLWLDRRMDKGKQVEADDTLFS
ncbi:MAG: DUF72 domain-containing protein [bacterium]